MATAMCSTLLEYTSEKHDVEVKRARNTGKDGGDTAADSGRHGGDERAEEGDTILAVSSFRQAFVTTCWSAWLSRMSTWCSELVVESMNLWARGMYHQLETHTQSRACEHRLAQLAACRQKPCPHAHHGVTMQLTVSCFRYRCCGACGSPRTSATGRTAPGRSPGSPRS